MFPRAVSLPTFDIITCVFLLAPACIVLPVANLNNYCCACSTGAPSFNLEEKKWVVDHHRSFFCV